MTTYAERLFKLNREQLHEKRRAIEEDPKSLNPPGCLYIFKPSARKKLEDIAWAFTHLIAEKRRETQT